MLQRTPEMILTGHSPLGIFRGEWHTPPMSVRLMSALDAAGQRYGGEFRNLARYVYGIELPCDCGDPDHLPRNGGHRHARTCSWCSHGPLEDRGDCGCPCCVDWLAVEIGYTAHCYITGTTPPHSDGSECDDACVAETQAIAPGFRNPDLVAKLKTKVDAREE